MKATCRPKTHVGQRKPTGLTEHRQGALAGLPRGTGTLWTTKEAGGQELVDEREPGHIWMDETRSLPRPLAGQRPQGSEREPAGQRGAGHALARPSMASRRVSSLATRAAVRGTKPGDEHPQAAMHDCDPALGFTGHPSNSLHARDHF